MPEDDIVKKNIAHDFKELVGEIPANAEQLSAIRTSWNQAREREVAEMLCPKWFEPLDLNDEESVASRSQSG